MREEIITISFPGVLLCQKEGIQKAGKFKIEIRRYWEDEVSLFFVCGACSCPIDFPDLEQSTISREIQIEREVK